jgi:hypothetical protein
VKLIRLFQFDSESIQSQAKSPAFVNMSRDVRRIQINLTVVGDDYLRMDHNLWNTDTAFYVTFFPSLFFMLLKFNFTLCTVKY